MHLEHGDILYMYTDGVVEATNTKDELYGEDRLKEILDRNSDKTAQEILKCVKEDVDAFAGEAVQFDDITMVGLRIL